MGALSGKHLCPNANLPSLLITRVPAAGANGRQGSSSSKVCPSKEWLFRILLTLFYSVFLVLILKMVGNGWEVSKLS